MVVIVARQGRELQRYSKGNGHRLVVGCIPYRFKNVDTSGDVSRIDQLEVLVITSQKGNNLLFPKGGWEVDEKMIQGARREALEEAGVQGDIEGRRLGKWMYKSKSQDAVHEGTMFALRVTEELEEWPEMMFRRREWVTVAKAREGCPHLWMREALENLVCRLLPSNTNVLGNPRP